MTTYAIIASTMCGTTKPALTCSKKTAELAKKEWEKMGYFVEIIEYELKTQGKNWNDIAMPKIKKEVK